MRAFIIKVLPVKGSRHYTSQKSKGFLTDTGFLFKMGEGGVCEEAAQNDPFRPCCVSGQI